LKKVMLSAALLAMVLAAAAPAFAQTATGGNVAILQYSCDQIQAAVNTQYQAGDGTGAVAGAAQSLGIDQQQVLACFGTAAAAQDVSIDVGTAKGKAYGTATATAYGGGGGGGGYGGGGYGGGGGAYELPPTGGASLIALGAGALLVAGGLLARRILR
jgi:hypothetical protein